MPDPADPYINNRPVPPFATIAPKPEAGTPNVGTMEAVPRADHQHPRLTATAKGTLSTGTGTDAAIPVGTRIVTFTQIFDNEPAVSIISVGAKTAGWPVPDFDFTFTTDANGKYIGGMVYGRRARPLPNQSQVAGTTLLTGLITGVNALAASIGGYDATEPAAGAGFSLIAVKQS